MASSTGESDSGSGASPPDEPVPGQTHDHPQRGDVTQRWPVAGQQHSSVPHPAELLPWDSGCGGELYAHVPVKLTCCRDVSFSPLVFLHPVYSGRGLCLQSEHQRRVRAEIPERRGGLAGRWSQWWGGDSCQTCSGLLWWQSYPSVRGQGARWVSPYM